MFPDATIGRFQSTQGRWALALLFACILCTSNSRRMEERRRDEGGCFCRLSAAEALHPGAAMCVHTWTLLGAGSKGRTRESAQNLKISEMEAV